MTGGVAMSKKASLGGPASSRQGQLTEKVRVVRRTGPCVCICVSSLQIIGRKRRERARLMSRRRQVTKAVCEQSAHSERSDARTGRSYVCLSV